MHVSTRQNLFTRLQKKRFEKYFNENIFGAKNHFLFVHLKKLIRNEELFFFFASKKNLLISIFDNLIVHFG